MNVLYLGDANGTSGYRIAALRRAGYVVEAIDPRDCIGRSRLAEAWLWHAGGIGMEAVIRRYVLGRLKAPRYDVCIVNHGEHVGPSLLRDLKPRVGAILHFNLDNPFVTRDHRRWEIMLRGFALYDLFAAPRPVTVAEAERRGVRGFEFTQTADEVMHRPRPFTPEDAARFGSDVSFIGTWMPGREIWIRALLDAGINVRIFGPNWHKAPNYEAIRSHVAIGHSLGAEDYARAVQYARIALGFLSDGNQDEHTSRSVEIPALSTLFCAKRTDKHLSMYRDGEEAVFWSDLAECATHCRALLSAPDRLTAIAAAGARRQADSRNWNEILMSSFIEEGLRHAKRAA